MLAAPDSVFDDIQPNILDAFRRYHAEHPEVLDLFADYARRVRGAGFERYSAKAIFEQIRWHENIERGNQDFKLNNNLTSAYSRALIQIDSTFASFFETRSSPGTVSTKQRPATRGFAMLGFATPSNPRQ